MRCRLEREREREGDDSFFSRSACLVSGLLVAAPARQHLSDALPIPVCCPHFKSLMSRTIELCNIEIRIRRIFRLKPLRQHPGGRQMALLRRPKVGEGRRREKGIKLSFLLFHTRLVLSRSVGRSVWLCKHFSSHLPRPPPRRGRRHWG